MELLLQYRNPGDQLRGIITISQSPEPRVFVTSTPAVTVGPDEIEPDVFIARCECFRLAGDGPNAVKAVEELSWTLRCHLEELLRGGILVAELEARGWRRVEAATSEEALLAELRRVSSSVDAITVSQVSISERTAQLIEAA